MSSVCAITTAKSASAWDVAVCAAVDLVRKPVESRPLLVIAGAGSGQAPSTPSGRACCASAGRIGLEAYFTISDRGDAEELLGLVRSDLGLN